MARKYLKGLQAYNLDNRLRDLSNDETLMKRVHTIFAEMCDPYVPYGETGELSNNITITAKNVVYNAPYARYQYYGKVYGPNIPMIINGEGTFRSPAGKAKHPTGAMIGDKEGEVGWFKPWRSDTGDYSPFPYVYGYNRGVHPLATHHWDEQMLKDVGKDFRRRLRLNITRYLNGTSTFR